MKLKMARQKLVENNFKHDSMLNWDLLRYIHFLKQPKVDLEQEYNDLIRKIVSHESLQLSDIAPELFKSKTIKEYCQKNNIQCSDIKLSHMPISELISK